MTITDVLIILFGAVTLFGAIRVVVSNHLVRAGLWLVVALGGLAACFLVLTAEFLAWVQVLIYIGAIVVLMLFAMMLTKAPIGESTDLDRNRTWGVTVGISTAAGLGFVFIDAYGWRHVDMIAVTPGSAEAIGHNIFGNWVLPFELLSVLLLSALVGAISVSATLAAKKR